MGGKQAAGVLTMVKEAQLKKKGKVLSEEQRQTLTEEILYKYEEQGNAYYSSARLWDDGIIDPRDTRKVLALGLSAAANVPFEVYNQPVYRM